MKNEIIEDKVILAKIDSGRLYNLNLPWREILHLASPLSFSKNTTILLQGRLSSDFFYLEKGLVCSKIFSRNGKERSNLFFGQDCLFNIAAALVKVPDPNEWECLEDVKVWRFSGELLTDRNFISSYPHLLVNLLQGMSINLVNQCFWNTEISLSTPLQRLARYLVGLSETRSGCLDFAPRITQQEAASYLGMHRATLAAAVKYLKKQQLISCFTYSRLHILDLNALKNVIWETHTRQHD